MFVAEGVERVHAHIFVNYSLILRFACVYAVKGLYTVL